MTDILQRRAKREVTPSTVARSQMSEAEALRIYWETRGQQADTRNKILLVDDSSTMRLLASVHLNHALPEHEIVEASDGEAALETLKQRGELAGEIALIVSDIQMPRVDGLELAEGLRGKNGYGMILPAETVQMLGAVPVIVHTGSGEYFEPGKKAYGRGQQLISEGVIQGLSNKDHGPMALRERIRQAFLNVN